MATVERILVPKDGLDAIANDSRVDRDHAPCPYRTVLREAELGLAPTDPADFVPQLVSELDLSTRIEQRAIESIRQTAELDLISGKYQKGYAAAAIDLFARLSDELVSQKVVAEVADVADVTIRNRYHQQADVLGIDYRSERQSTTVELLWMNDFSTEGALCEECCLAPTFIFD